MAGATMTNPGSKARVRILRYLLEHIRQVGISDADLAKALGVSKDRIRKIRTVTPQSHVLQRIGACLEYHARHGRLPDRPRRRRAVRKSVATAPALA